MAQPLGYIHTSFPTHVCKLRKAIYDLKQAPRAWNTMLKNTLLSWGFTNSPADTSLFFYRKETTIVLLLVYIDDVIITGNNTSMINLIVTKLDNTFSLKDLGPLSYFLGIQTTWLGPNLLLTQSKYIDDLLTKLNLTSLKPAPTPSTVGKHFSTSKGTP